MLLSSLFGWWYISGWEWLAKEIWKRLHILKETFSVGILLKTLFSPWKQIQTVSTFQNFFQAAIDNLVSRFIGATVRIFMLIGALLLTLAVTIFGIICLVVWPIIPLLLIILPYLTLSHLGVL